MNNPWNLTPREAQVMDAVCEHGCAKLVARHLDLAVVTIEQHRQRANKKIGAQGVLTAVRWDRFRRGDRA